MIIIGWDDISNSGSSTSEKVEFTKFAEGNTVIRVVESEPFSRWSHWMKNAKRAISCPGKGCPICNIIQSAKANKEPAIYNSTKRHTLHIINRNSNKLEILEQGKMFFQQLLDFNNEIGSVTEYDIKVIRKGTGINDTNYTLIPMPAKPLSEEDIKLKEGIIDLKEFFCTTYK